MNVLRSSFLPSKGNETIVFRRKCLIKIRSTRAVQSSADWSTFWTTFVSQIVEWICRNSLTILAPALEVIWTTPGLPAEQVSTLPGTSAARKVTVRARSKEKATLTQSSKNYLDKLSLFALLIDVTKLTGLVKISKIIKSTKFAKLVKLLETENIVKLQVRSPKWSQSSIQSWCGEQDADLDPTNTPLSAPAAPPCSRHGHRRHRRKASSTILKFLQLPLLKLLGKSRCGLRVANPQLTTNLLSCSNAQSPVEVRSKLQKLLAESQCEVGSQLTTNLPICSNADSAESKPRTTTLKRWLAALTIVLNDPFLAKRLLQCGDVEVNPGPEPNATVNNGPKRDVDLQVVTFNVRGLGDEKKCRHLINHFNKKYTNKNVDSVIALQETLIQTAMKIPFLWRGNLYITPGTGNGRGCITLVSNHLSIISHTSIEDRAHVLALQKLGDPKITYIVANIYAPNAHNEAKIIFFEEVLDRIAEFEERFECDNVILLGDFNLIFNDYERVNRAFSGNEKRVADSVARLLEEADLCDAWNGNKVFTWRRANSNVMSMLDRVMYRTGKLICAETKASWAISSSDHAAVISQFTRTDSSPNPKRVNIPRLDPSLLSCKFSSDKIEKEFIEMFGTRDPNWDPHTTLEFAKMCLRSVVERVQAEKRKKDRSDEDEVNESLNRLIEKLGGVLEVDEKEEIITLIEALRCRKEVIIEEKGKRLAERLATKWYNEGEKSTKYFMRLLNRQAPDRLDHLVQEDGTVIRGIAEINQAVVDYYKKLYEDYDDALIQSIDSDEEFFDNIDRCTPNDDLSVAAPVTLSDLTEALKSCGDTAPGPDGVTYGYLRHFWAIFGQLLVDCWNHTLRTGKLAPSHKSSFLRLIPKAGKDVKRLTNWRPITLSNCDHKLITKVYSKRLVEAADKLIEENQTAYIKGRMINDNLRTLISAIKVANEEDALSGLVVSLDAKKAFDSVEHQYIRKCLSKFGFESFVPIFNILYKDLKSDIIINGGIHSGYKINRGVKQGDALSCILFIMCMEPLIRNLERSQDIDPIFSTNLQADLPKALAYADDVSCVIKDNPASIQGVFNEYERLSKLSGLQLNADKTEFLLLDKIAEPENRRITFDYLHQVYNCEPKAVIKVNGILLQMSQDEMRTSNVGAIVKKMEAHLWGWSKRGLSTLGKILAVKTFGISQIIYLLQTMSLKPNDFKKFNATLYKFIWNRNFGAPKAPERIKREIINTPVKFGGFGMLDIEKLDRSLKLKMLSRLLSSKHPFLVLILSKINMNDFFFPVSNQKMDEPINQAISHLAKDRRDLFLKEDITSVAKAASLIREIKLCSILSGPGKLSLAFFRLRIQGKTKIKDLVPAELRSIERFIKYQGLTRRIQDVINLNVASPIDEDAYLYWYRGLKPLARLTAKHFREAQETSQPICVYKIGAVLSPTDNLSWAYKLRKLTSTKHKNVLLKIAHGECYSKARLHRFGLTDDPNCDTCGQLETIKHKAMECPVKLEIWRYLAEKEGYDLDNAAEPMEFVLGMHPHENPTILALHAELLQLVLYRSPELTPARTIEILTTKLNAIDGKLKGKFNI